MNDFELTVPDLFMKMQKIGPREGGGVHGIPFGSANAHN